MDILIRHSGKNDAGDITKIFLEKSNYRNTLGVPHLRDNIWEQRVNEMPLNIIQLVAVAEEKVVGIVSLCIETNIRRKHYANIGISISEKYQNNKIGSRLLKEILDLADNWHNIKRIELEVYTDNEKAVNFYKKFGFKIEGTLKDYVFEEKKYIYIYIYICPYYGSVKSLDYNILLIERREKDEIHLSLFLWSKAYLPSTITTLVKVDSRAFCVTAICLFSFNLANFCLANSASFLATST